MTRLDHKGTIFTFLGQALDEELHAKALLYLKSDIPANYYDDGSWNLTWAEAPFQVGNLMQFLVKLPGFNYHKQ
ncbi:MAG: hypothetical protein IPP37_20370 [Saprospiraceae bacterium]|nr:hypothetical protein [Saprospiraceae bacterium]